MGKQWKQCQTLFLGAPKSLQMLIAAMKLKDAYSLEGNLPARTWRSSLCPAHPCYSPLCSLTQDLAQQGGSSIIASMCNLYLKAALQAASQNSRRNGMYLSINQLT